MNDPEIVNVPAASVDNFRLDQIPQVRTPATPAPTAPAPSQELNDVTPTQQEQCISTIGGTAQQNIQRDVLNDRELMRSLNQCTRTENSNTTFQQDSDGSMRVKGAQLEIRRRF